MGGPWKDLKVSPSQQVTPDDKFKEAIIMQYCQAINYIKNKNSKVYLSVSLLTVLAGGGSKVPSTASKADRSPP